MGVAVFRVWYVENVGELEGLRLARERFFDISASNPRAAHEVAKKAFRRLFGSIPQEFYIYQIGA